MTVIKELNKKNIVRLINFFNQNLKSKGIKFDEKNYPIFDKTALGIIQTNKLRGNFSFDFQLADKILGIDRLFREKYEITWLHSSNGIYMYLLPNYLVHSYNNYGFTITSGAANILYYFSTQKK
jgi:hypothetical protein